MLAERYGSPPEGSRTLSASLARCIAASRASNSRTTIKIISILSIPSLEAESRKKNLCFPRVQEDRRWKRFTQSLHHAQEELASRQFSQELWERHSLKIFASRACDFSQRRHSRITSNNAPTNLILVIDRYTTRSEPCVRIAGVQQISSFLDICPVSASDRRIILPFKEIAGPRCAFTISAITGTISEAKLAESARAVSQRARYQRRYDNDKRRARWKIKK